MAQALGLKVLTGPLLAEATGTRQFIYGSAMINGRCDDLYAHEGKRHQFIMLTDHETGGVEDYWAGSVNVETVKGD